MKEKEEKMEEKIDYYQFLMKKYNKLVLNATEVAIELGITRRKVVESCTACSASVPSFKRVGREYKFPINEVAYFLSHNLVKVM